MENEARFVFLGVCNKMTGLVIGIFAEVKCIKSESDYQDVGL